MNRLKIKTELAVEEIEQRYRSASEGVGRSQWQIIWLLAQGKTSQEVRTATGYSLTWIRTIARRYNGEGEAGLGDKRHHNLGRQGALSIQQAKQLKELLQAAVEGHEPWSARQVMTWLSEQVGHPVHVQRAYEWLAKLGFSAQVPRPRHVEANPADQQVFKKSFRKVSPH
jgi:transposase